MSDDIVVNMNFNLGKDQTVDDIVTRLRQEWEYGNNAKGCDYEMFAQAADEIERLQNRLEKFERAAWELSMYGVFTDSSLGRKALMTYTEAVRGD